MATENTKRLREETNRLQPLFFPALAADGMNYLEWSIDARAHLCAEELDQAMKPPEASTSTSTQLPKASRWKALLILRRHLDSSLRTQYLQLEDPATLWSELHGRFHHEKTIFLPQARNDWMTLRVLDFTDLSKYNSELHRIVAHLRMCGETITESELIEKTLTTFPPASALLAQQYRNMQFKKFNQLMSLLLLAEKQHQLLLKNAEVKPPKEAHAVEAKGSRRAYRDKDKSKTQPRRQLSPQKTKQSNRDSSKPKADSKRKSDHDSRDSKICHKCGRPGHLAKDCRASDYVAKLWKELSGLKSQTPPRSPRRGSNQREAHSLDAPSFPEYDVENYLLDTSHLADTSSDVALIDSATTHTILRDPRYFTFSEANPKWQTCSLLTIAGNRDFKYREGKASFRLPGGRMIRCDQAMYAPTAPRSLISFKDLRRNGIHLSTSDVQGDEVLELWAKDEFLATAKAAANGLYGVRIVPAIAPLQPRLQPTLSGPSPSIPRGPTHLTAFGYGPCIPSTPAGPAHATEDDAARRKGPSPSNPWSSAPTKNAEMWHNRLGHPGATMLRRMVPLLTGHTLCTSDVHMVGTCGACVQGKYSKRPSQWKLPTELPQPLQRLQGDVCGPISPPSGPFRYFLVLVDASGVHAEVSLLTTRNLVFPKLLAMLLRMRTHFPDFLVKNLRMDNALEFKSHNFEDFCTASGISLTYSVPYEHSQNGLAEAYIKKIQLVVRPLLIQANLPPETWGHAVLHAAALLRLRPTLLNANTSQELITGSPPNVAHLRNFGCKVWVPQAEPKIKTTTPHRISGIYVGFDSPSIIRYLTLPTLTSQRARFQNCRFEETVFPSIPSAKEKGTLDFFAPETFTMNPDPKTALAEVEVKKLLQLKNLAERLPDGFTDHPKILRNPAPGTGLSPLLPQKRKLATVSLHSTLATDPTPSPEDLDGEPANLEAAKRSQHWKHWETALKAEYDSIRKHKVFGQLNLTLRARPVGHKLIFSKKRDAQGRFTRFKVRLVAQGFSQRPGVDFISTYSPVLDSTTFRYLLALTVHLSLKIQLLDVVTAYLYGPLDSEIYIKPPPEFLDKPLPQPTPGHHVGLRIHKALYGLKQSGRMWYKHLRDYLMDNKFLNDQALPCVFTYRTGTDFAIVAVYVDDINIIGTSPAVNYAANLLTSKFEMKNLGRTTLCLGLQIEHLPDGSIFLHQTMYAQRILKRFQMDQATPISAPMIGPSKTSQDPYLPCKEEEEEVDKDKYLAAVGAFLYLSTNTRPDISFSVSVLARHSQKPGARHWAGVKHLFRYLRGTEDLGLHYTKEATANLVGYADAGYKSDPVTGKSQTAYLFLKNGAPVSWKSVKQTVTATSTNHAELIAFHEASRELVWLRTLETLILGPCGIMHNGNPTVLYEDNAACLNQVTAGFIKADRTKHIDPKIFSYTQDLIQEGKLEAKKIDSAHNLADILTKALPSYTHKRLVHESGMRLLHEII